MKHIKIIRKPARRQTQGEDTELNDTAGFLGTIAAGVVTGVITTLIMQKFLSPKKQYRYLPVDSKRYT